jgi:ketosteroid isomerase-like protein|tara:strand:- start:160 stop:609 length:450 start_codon:yes stop_codon:yes gene_type:complete
MEQQTMSLKVILLILASLPVMLFAQEAEIENEYNGYLEDFMIFDFEGIASHFTPPVMFIGPSTQVMQDENAIKNYYHVLKANIQSGYAYSISNLEINQVTDKIYCLTNTFTRHNSADEVLFEGTSYNFFKETESGWKLFLMQASALPDL